MLRREEKRGEWVQSMRFLVSFVSCKHIEQRSMDESKREHMCVYEDG